jgi:hypothetical protein
MPLSKPAELARLPAGFHRIRCYGVLTSPTRANNIARIRGLLAVPLIPIDALKAATSKPEQPKGRFARECMHHLKMPALTAHRAR